MVYGRLRKFEDASESLCLSSLTRDKSTVSSSHHKQFSKPHGNTTDTRYILAVSSLYSIHEKWKVLKMDQGLSRQVLQTQCDPSDVLPSRRFSAAKPYCELKGKKKKGGRGGTTETRLPAPFLRLSKLDPDRCSLGL